MYDVDYNNIPELLLLLYLTNHHGNVSCVDTVRTAH